MGPRAAWPATHSEKAEAHKKGPPTPTQERASLSCPSPHAKPRGSELSSEALSKCWGGSEKVSMVSEGTGRWPQGHSTAHGPDEEPTVGTSPGLF